MAVKPDLGITALLDQIMAHFRDNEERLMELAKSDDSDPLISTMALYVLMNLGSEQAFFQMDTLADVERFYEKIDEVSHGT